MSKLIPVIITTCALVAFSGCARKIKGSADSSMAGQGQANGPIEEIQIDTTTAGLDATSASAYGDNFEETRTRVDAAGLAPLYFSFDSDLVPELEVEKVNAAVLYLQQHNDQVMVVEGHCDERGSSEYNVSLSELRANAVKNYMVTLGIAAERIQTHAFGEEKPAVLGSDENSLSKNRRAEFVPYK